MTLLDAGSEAILFEPYYGYHVAHLQACGVTPRFVPLGRPNWQLDEAALDAAVSSRTRAIVVNTPSNPSGKVFTRAELEFIAKLANRHNLWVITDEIYEHFVYDGAQHTSPASLDSLRERTITISGFSKTFSITGWRVGFCAAEAHIAERLGLANDLIYICSPAPLQAGVAAGLSELGPDFYTQLAAAHAKKRERICDALDRAGLTPSVPQGSYYVLADISRIPGETGRERVLNLLANTGVAAVAGSAFFEPGRGDELARFCYAKTDAELEEACRRLENASF